MLKFLLLLLKWRSGTNRKLDVCFSLRTCQHPKRLKVHSHKLFKEEILSEGYKTVTKRFSTGVCVSACVLVCSGCHGGFWKHTPPGSVYLFLKVFFSLSLHTVCKSWVLGDTWGSLTPRIAIRWTFYFLSTSHTDFPPSDTRSTQF